MKKIITVAILIAVVFQLNGQNRIANSSFEFIKPGEPSNVPYRRGHANKIEGWYSQVCCWKKQYFDSNWATIDCDNEDPELYDYKPLHSPDWFNLHAANSSTLPYPLRLPVEDYPGSWVIPNSGSKFVGMGAGELIQHRLYAGSPFSSEGGQHLTPGNTYYLSFYIQLFKEARYYGRSEAFGAEPPNSDARLKITNAANRIKYQNNHPDDLCDENDFNTYLAKKESEGGTQHIVTLGTIDLSSTVYPYYEWHQVWIEFVAPQHYGLNHHDWIAIELQDWGNDVCKSYVGIDDVKLMECPPTESCSPTYGEIYPTFSGSHTATEPWRIDGISNARRLELEIWPMNGGNITQLAVECDHGFPNGWEWSGQNAQGAEFANGNYVYELRAKNQCGTARFTGNFAKINASNNPTNVSELFFGCGGVTYVPPKQCCEHEPIMYIDDHHWIDQEFTLHASSELIVASNAPVIVGDGSNVIMRAQERIELNPGFSSDNADYFLAEIVPCGYVPPPAQRLAGPEVEPEDMQASMDSESKTNTDVEPDFSIYPNPNSGSFIIAGTAIQQVIITDATGKLVRQLNGGLRSQVQIDGLSSGLYLVRAQMADGSVKNGKVVVQ